MKELARLVAINKLSQKDSNWIHRDIFRILYQDNIWILAYQKVKKFTSKNLSQNIEEMSLARLRKLKESVCSESYKFESKKLTSISNLNTHIKLLTTDDKIIQKVIFLILEAIYEPIFSDYAFGFGSGLGHHHALDYVEKNFKRINFIIKKNSKQEKPRMDNHMLVKFLEKRIDDPRFIRLIWKILRSESLAKELTLTACSKITIPQERTLSTILSHIYFHELDTFLQKLLKKYTILKIQIKSLKYRALENKIFKLSKKINMLPNQSIERKKAGKTLKVLRSKLLKVSRFNNSFTRIEYVRHAESWMIGILGDRKLAHQIKAEVTMLMKNKLHQNYQTKVIDIHKGNASFLGYEIFLLRHRPISNEKKYGQQKLRFDIPLRILLKSYTKRGYLKKLKKGVRPISKASYTVLEDHLIVKHYRTLWLSVFNYYSGCTNRGKLQYIQSLLHMSCAMTLAHRHRLTSKKIFQKYGKTLRIKVPGSMRHVQFPDKMTCRSSERKWLLEKKTNLRKYF